MNVSSSDAGQIREAHLTLDFSVFAQAITPPDPQAIKNAEVQAKMDGCRDKASGPYLVKGQSTAPPMFRMPAHRIDPENKAELAKIAERAGLSTELFAFKMGQPFSRALVKMTQALIDAGKLPSTPSDPAKAIKAMQWKYGIGFDCAAYSKEALSATHDRKLSFHGPGSEGFRDLDTTRSVYDNKVVDDAKRAELIAKGGARAAAFLETDGAKRVLVVDSSPSGDRYHGVYRPR